MKADFVYDNKIYYISKYGNVESRDIEKDDDLNKIPHLDNTLNVKYAFNWWLIGCSLKYKFNVIVENEHRYFKYNLLERQFEYLDKDDINIKYEIDNTELNFKIIDEL